MKKIVLTFASLMMIGTSAITWADDNGAVDVYFVRHGQTIFNQYDRVQGWSDTPLTKAGVDVAYAFGLGTKDIHFSKYYSSDLGRQRETLAQIMKVHGTTQKPIELKGLREVFFGGFEGLPNETMNGAAGKVLGVGDGKQVAALREQGKIVTTDLVDAIHKSDEKGDAETALQVRERMQKVLHDIVQDALANHEKNILAVSSGMSIAVMISDMTDDPLKDKAMKNAAVVKIEYRNGKYVVKDIGDTRYITEGEKRVKP